ncbi:MAG: integrase family protein [Alphaproteobacteria bacterium]|nr:integrase family protein [Alphaproteobacteria bacterium]
MAQQKLTKKLVQDFPLAMDKQSIIWDTEFKGFGVLINQSTKTYIVQKKFKGRAIRTTIGRTDILATDTARHKARKIALEISEGVNYNQAKQRPTLTLINVHQQYIKHKSHLLKQGTIANYVDHIENHFADWQNKLLTNIDAYMVIDKFQKLTKEKGTYAANNSMRYLSALFNYIGADDISLANPVEILRKKRLWNKKTRRATLIKDADMPYWYQAVMGAENDSFRDALLLLLFTGMRKMEAFTLRWNDIDFAERTLTINDTKNNKPLTVPMTDFIYDLLQARKFQARKCHARDAIWVFDGRFNGRFDSGEGHITDAKKTIAGICRTVAKLRDNELKNNGQAYKFMLHDLRRTFITMADRVGVSTHRIKLLVNHSTANDVTSGYIHIELEQLREASQKITDALKEKLDI